MIFTDLSIDKLFIRNIQFVKLFARNNIGISITVNQIDTCHARGFDNTRESAITLLTKVLYISDTTLSVDTYLITADRGFIKHRYVYIITFIKKLKKC